MFWWLMGTGLFLSLFITFVMFQAHGQVVKNDTCAWNPNNSGTGTLIWAAFQKV